jgi:hypothetical protein
MGTAGCSLDLSYLGPPAVDATPQDAGGDEVTVPPDASLPDSSAHADAAAGRDGGDDGGNDGSDGGRDAGDGGNDASSDGAPPNRIVDPGFEDGTTGWHAWEGTVVASTAQAHSGAYSGCLVGASQDGRGPAQDVTAVVQPSSTYSFDSWVWWRSAAGGDAGATPYEDVKVFMVALCPDGSAHFTACVNGNLAPEGTWTELKGVCDGSIVGLCGEAGAPRVELYFETPDPGIGLCLDDVSLTSN